jgi:tetratricopeptide (TPR) repeat protein
MPVSDKKAAQIYHRLGSLYLKKGLIQAALQEWGKAQQAAPTFLDAYFDSAQQYVKMSKPDRAVETLEQAAAQVRDGDLHTKLGLLYVDIGDLDEGIAHSRLAVELKPSSPEAHYAAGRAYSRQAEIQEAIRLGPASNLRILPVIEPSWRDAAAHFQQAIELNPDLAKARISLATAYLRQNMPDEAADAASAAAEASQEDAHILNQCGYIHYTIGRAEIAVDYLRRSIALKKTFWKLNLLACVYSSLKRCDKAIETLNEGLDFAVTDWDRALIHSNLSSAALGEGRIDDTIREAELAIELQFDHIHARCNLSSALLAKGEDPERIIRICREGVEFGPNHICFHGKLARALLRTGELEEALSEANIAVELEPEECEPRILRAKVLEALGRVDEAREDLQAALALDPENAEAKNVLEDLIPPCSGRQIT